MLRHIHHVARKVVRCSNRARSWLLAGFSSENSDPEITRELQGEDISFYLEGVKYYDHHLQTVGTRETIDSDHEGTFSLSGWALNPFTQTTPDGIIYTDPKGKVIGTTKCGIARWDIAEAFKNKNALISGWKISCDKTIPCPIEEIRFYSYIRNKNAAYLIVNWNPAVDHEAKKIEEELWLASSGLPAPDKTRPYYSCYFLEGGLFFYDQNVYICCEINLNSPTPSDSILLCQSASSKFSLQKIQEKRKQVIEKNQTGGYPACQGCKHLRKKTWPYRRDLFYYLNLGHDTSCNLLCKFCPAVKVRSPHATPTDDILTAVRTLAESNYLAKNANVAISGGEPAMMKGLDKVINFLNNGEYQVLIATNGTIFSQAIADSLRTRRTTLTVSVDAVGREVYKNIKGKDYCHHVWDNIKKYAEIDGTKVIPKMIIMEENADEVEAFVQRSIESGVKSVMFDYDLYTVPDQKIIDAMKRFKKYCDDHGILGIPARPSLAEI
jgi:organic radical activating enzyme